MYRRVHSTKSCYKNLNIPVNFGFGTVQKRVNLVMTYYNVNLEKMPQNETLVAKLGFDAEDNRPSKICATNPQPPPPPWIKKHVWKQCFCATYCALYTNSTGSPRKGKVVMSPRTYLFARAPLKKQAGFLKHDNRTITATKIYENWWFASRHRKIRH